MAALLVSYLALIPLVAGFISDGLHDLARYSQLLLLMSTGCFALHQARPVTTSRRMIAASLLVGLLAMSSVVCAPVPTLAAREVLLFVSLGVLVQTCSRVEPGANMLVGFVWAQAAYAALVLAVLLAGLVVQHMVDFTHIALGYDNIRFLSHSQTVSTPLLLAFLGSASLSRRGRVLAIGVATFNLFMTSLLQARATTVALVFIGVAAPILFGRTGWRFSRRLGVVAVSGVLLHVVVMFCVPQLLGIELPPSYRPYAEASSIEARLFLLSTAWTDILTHPWLGIGPMHFAHYFNGEAAHPHNIYVQVATEYGLPFAILALPWLGLTLWRTTRLIRQHLPEDSLAIGSLLACLAALVDGCFSGNFVMPMSQMWIVFAVAVLLSRLRTVAPEEKREGSITIKVWVVRAGLAALLLGQIWLVAVSWPEWHSANPVVTTGGPKIQSEHYSPRFWRDGWF